MDAGFVESDRQLDHLVEDLSMATGEKEKALFEKLLTQADAAMSASPFTVFDALASASDLVAPESQEEVALFGLAGRVLCQIESREGAKGFRAFLTDQLAEGEPFGLSKDLLLPRWQAAMVAQAKEGDPRGVAAQARRVAKAYPEGAYLAIERAMDFVAPESQHERDLLAAADHVLETMFNRQTQGAPFLAFLTERLTRTQGITPMASYLADKWGQQVWSLHFFKRDGVDLPDQIGKAMLSRSPVLSDAASKVARHIAPDLL